jgi:hypothetical protein
MSEPNEQAKNAAEGQPATEPKAELPHVESPPLSLAEEMRSMLVREKIVPEPLEPMRAPFASAPDIKLEPEAAPASTPRRLSMPRLGISRRLRRTAALAATVMIAAGLGAAFGAAVHKRQEPPAVQRDAALIEENAAMQKSIGRLTKELAALKTSVESANKDSQTRVTKLTDRFDKLAETTGSITKQAAVTPAPAAAPSQPAPQVAAVVPTEPTPMPPARPHIAQQERRVLQGWTIYQIRNGVAWVENGGEVFAAQVGVPLPGLGRVEAVRRDGNQWLVFTAKGVISSAGESTAEARPKPYYPPYYRR